MKKKDYSRDPRFTPDDVLIDIATTCSSRQVALSAEVELRRRHPSRKAARSIKRALAGKERG